MDPISMIVITIIIMFSMSAGFLIGRAAKRQAKPKPDFCECGHGRAFHRRLHDGSYGPCFKYSGNFNVCECQQFVGPLTTTELLAMTKEITRGE